MKAAKTDTHDWVRLRLDDGIAKVNLTWSRSGDTVSGSLLAADYKLSQRLAEAWSKYRDSKTIEGSLGKRLDIAMGAAKGGKTIANFVAWLEENE